MGTTVAVVAGVVVVAAAASLESASIYVFGMS